MCRPNQDVQLVVAFALISILSGCRNSAQVAYIADDIAKAAQRLDLPESSARTILGNVAAGSRSSTDDLARAIVAANDPGAAYQRAISRLLQADVPEDVGKGVLCDTLAEAMLNPDKIDAQSIGVSVARNLAAKLGGDVGRWAESADSMARDIAGGEHSHPLWARVFMLKLRYC